MNLVVLTVCGNIKLNAKLMLRHEKKNKGKKKNLQVTDLLRDDVSVFVCELFLADLLPRNVLNLVALQTGTQVCSAHSRVIFVFL